VKVYDQIEQGTEEWLNLRLGKFTASKAQTIQANGSGLDTLCLVKVIEILTGTREQNYVSADMERGNELEPSARNLYEIQTGNIVNQVGFIELDEWIGCSPDGLVGEDGMTEFKCPSDIVFLKYMLSKKINMGYYWQMQMQMWVANRKWNDYGVYNESFKNRLIVRRVKRNDRDIAKIKLGIKTGIRGVKQILKKVR